MILYSGPEKPVGSPGWIWIILVLIISLYLVSCSPSPEPGSDPAALIVALPRGPLNLDPRLSVDAASYQIMQLTYNSLVNKSPSSRLLPDLAEKWSQPDDRTYIFDLRRGVTWHDGSPFTSQDVAYTFRSILDPKTKSPKRQGLGLIQTIETPDPHRVIFRLKEVFSPFLINLVLGIVPQSVETREGTNFGFHPVGTGPFKFQSWEEGRQVTLVKNTAYFGTPAKLSRLVFRIIPDDTTRLLEFKKGSIDFMQNAAQPDMVPLLKADPRFQVIQSPGTNYSYIGFNLIDPILKNRQVREALAHAIDVRAMIKFLLRDAAQPASGVLPPSNWAYEPEVPVYLFDPKKAARLLDEAGYPDRGDGQGRFKITYKTSDNDMARLKAEIIQQQLADVGIMMDIRTYDWGTFFGDIRNGNFQMFSLEWVGVTDPDVFYYIFHSASFPPNGANRGRYANPEVDALIDQGRRTLDEAKAKAIYSRLQKILAYDLPYISLWYVDNVALAKKSVQGFVQYPAGDLYSLRDVYRTDGAPPANP
ncbi:MAG: ABC transporter substrate-binding protein [Deltaproteobacteria bacterium]|nr:ABC transporter substrate-binding protein [Deltaproteobacteria bacterium]